MSNAINYQATSADAQSAWLAYKAAKKGPLPSVVDFIAGWNAAQFAAKVDAAVASLNQCDGCRQGLPVNSEGNHTSSNGKKLFMGCTKDRYT